jgi:hypothetical protein
VIQGEEHGKIQNLFCWFAVCQFAKFGKLWLGIIRTVVPKPRNELCRNLVPNCGKNKTKCGESDC